MDISYIDKLKNHNTDCFEEIYFKYNKPLFNYFRNKIKSSSLCEDLIQETFIRLWRFRTGLDEHIAFEIQLFRIAKTTLIDIIRRQSRGIELYMPVEELPDIQKEEIYPFNRSEEMRDRLQCLFTSLSPVRRQILNMKIEGYSNKEIAKQLAITVKTVENNINLAYKELRKLAKVAPILLLVLILL